MELKLSAVGEKKNCLKAQLEQLTREMAAREEEHKQTTQMESLVKNYEKKNQELEEREMEVRYRLQMLENTMPALLMWNMWRMMVAMQQSQTTVAGAPPAPTRPGAPPVPGTLGPMNPKEEELISKLQALEARLNTENRMLQDSRNAEEALRNKVHDLEMILDSKDTNIIQILDRDPGQDIEAFEKMTKMAKERIEMKRRIKDLELKEHMYQETLQEFDGMFSDLEVNYTKQLKEKDDALSDKEAKLAETEFKLNQSKKISAENTQLHEKLVQLEQEMKILTEALKKRETERDALEREERKLNQELQDCLAELENLKRQVEGPMLGQLEIQKKKGLQLEQELERLKDEKFEMEANRKAEVYPKPELGSDIGVNKTAVVQPSSEQASSKPAVERAFSAPVTPSENTVISRPQRPEATPAPAAIQRESGSLASTAVAIGVVHVIVYLFMAFLSYQR